MRGASSDRVISSISQFGYSGRRNGCTTRKIVPYDSCFREKIRIA
jgi:hypothetical protein